MSTVKSLTPPEAWDVLQKRTEAVLLDVRDPLEFSYVGHPRGAVNIPWKRAPDWKPDPDFVERVRQAVPNADTPLFVLCRSGQRSLEAAKVLASAGYSDVTNIEQGFEGPLDEHKHRSSVGGWRYHGLPWEQS
ncbi:rhodanese-like domain-containing protein [Methylocaldum szegediense]|uniref:Creatinine amidohydrolase n=1 Tax=Methylocaldum szegediense TaxID=73780 RepID=A0ABM9I0E1_9GAMM|nr:rhodanese-like domain-containing protein [Methylocaldum szegediense]CAI8807511.1 creatinine amidohydrolase [Methylocaldum szegediense]